MPVRGRIGLPAIACALIGCAGNPSTRDLDYWIARHTEARGGRAAIEAIRSIEIELRIEEPTFEVDGRYFGTRAGQMRIDAFAGGKRVFTEAYDGSHGWQLDANDSVAAEASAQGTAALRHGIEFPFKVYGLHELKARGHRLALLAPETIGAVTYPVIELTLSDGLQVRYYLDPATGLVARERQKRALHVDVDATERWIETRYEDYRAVDGVMYPFRHVESEVGSGAFLSRGTVQAMRANPPLDPRLFEMPR
jgi:hypothetical protein